MAGYSGTPLIKKLGIKEGMNIYIPNAPKEFWNELGELPNVIVAQKLKKELDVILYLFDSKKEFETLFPKFESSLVSNGMLWVGWRKKSSKIATDLSENIIRDFGLQNGLVDVKVCAITEIWSGLKFVRRLKDRKD